jgi:membrane-associated phospholipid phosphatase
MHLYNLNIRSTNFKIYISLCILWWIFGIVLLSYNSPEDVYKWINTHHSPFLDKIMPFITYLGEFSLIAIIGIIVLYIYRKYEVKKLLFLMILCNGIPTLINVVLKNLFAQHRPLYYFEHAEWIHLVAGQPKQYHLSFPSGHTEGAFAMMTFIALLLPKKWKWLAIFLFMVALLAGYSRIYLSQHFFQDILAGSMIGTIFCLLTFIIAYPRLLRTKLVSTL